MPSKEREKTTAFIAKYNSAPAEDMCKFSLFAQFIDTSQPNGKINLEYYLKELLNIDKNKNDGWTTEFDLKNVALLLYQRALLSQTKGNGWFLTRNCKTILKALKTDEVDFKPLSKTTTNAVGFFSSEKKEDITHKKSQKNSPNSSF